MTATCRYLSFVLSPMVGEYQVILRCVVFAVMQFQSLDLSFMPCMNLEDEASLGRGEGRIQEAESVEDSGVFDRNGDGRLNYLLQAPHPFALRNP